MLCTKGGPASEHTLPYNVLHLQGRPQVLRVWHAVADDGALQCYHGLSLPQRLSHVRMHHDSKVVLQGILQCSRPSGMHACADSAVPQMHTRTETWNDNVR
jgi:hypothetical protein